MSVQQNIKELAFISLKNMVKAHSSSKTFQKNKLVRLKVIGKMTPESLKGL